MERQYFYHIPEPVAHPHHLQWHLDPRLKRYIHKRIPEECSIEQVVAIAQILVEEVQQLNEDPKNTCTLAQQNLSGSITALLAHSLFRKRRVRLDSYVEILQRYFPLTELADVYQISLIVISRPAQFLRNFQPGVDWYPSLCRYSYVKFPKSLTDELRRLAGDDFKRTNLGLLNRCSLLLLEKCLKQSSEKGKYADRLLLLYQCIRETVEAQTFNTKDPQPIHYDALLARYQQRKQATDLEIVDRQEAIELTTYLSNVIRNYYQPTSGALSLDLPDNLNPNVTLGDLQEDSRQYISLEERDKMRQAIELLYENSPIHQASILANPNMAKVRSIDLTFFLLDGLRLNQTELGKEFDSAQDRISRQRKRELARLAKELYFRYENKPRTTQLSAETQQEYIRYIEPICEDYYANLAIDMLAELTASAAASSIIDSHSAVGVSLPLGTADAPLTERLCQRFIQRIETNWQFQFKPEGRGLNRLYTFVREQQHQGQWDNEDNIHPSLRRNED
jgi:hypothetical protein